MSRKASSTPVAPACDRHGVANCTACHGRNHEQWGVLSEDGLRVLNQSRVTHSYEPSQVIFYQGNPCLGIYCVDAGEVAIRKTDEHGNSAIVRLAHAGQCIGYRAFFAGTGYTATAEALTRCQVCFVPRDVVRKLVEAEPKLGMQFLKRAADELRESEEARLAATSLSVRARLAHFLVTLKDQRGVVGDDNVLSLELPLSRKDLAALLGTRRESIARAIRALEDAGVAKFAGREVIIEDLDSLLDELEGVETLD